LRPSNCHRNRHQTPRCQGDSQLVIDQVRKNASCHDDKMEAYCNTSPNGLRTDQKHHDPKTHESRNSPKANRTRGSNRSDRSRAPVRPV
jgi:hypothetical protein